MRPSIIASVNQGCINVVEFAIATAVWPDDSLAPMHQPCIWPRCQRNISMEGLPKALPAIRFRESASPGCWGMSLWTVFPERPARAVRGADPARPPDDCPRGNLDANEGCGNPSPPLLPRRRFPVVRFKVLFLGLTAVLVAGFAPGDEVIPDWPAPATWSPHSVSRGASALGAITSPYPFIGVTPCRQYDSRNFTPLPQNTSRSVVLTGAPCGLPPSPPRCRSTSRSSISAPPRTASSRSAPLRLPHLPGSTSLRQRPSVATPELCRWTAWARSGSGS